MAQVRSRLVRSLPSRFVCAAASVIREQGARNDENKSVKCLLEPNPVLWKLAFFSTKCLRKTDATLQRDSFLPPWLLHVCPSILNTKTGDRQPPKRYLVTTVTHLQSNSVKVDQQTQSADKLCRKSHPTSMFGNSSAVQNRKISTVSSCVSHDFPIFSL